ncbi:MAG: hypothetical protein JNM59_04375 [Hyphomonadaceae bacterium]|nr:hypothetical protein [Hyphomonadaceae bacterium]
MTAEGNSSGARGTPTVSGGLLVGGFNGNPVDAGGNVETRSVTVGDGAGGSYTQFSGSSADGTRAIEGGALVIGVAQGAAVAYGTSQTTTFTGEDVARAAIGVYGPIIDDFYDDGN